MVETVQSPNAIRVRTPDRVITVDVTALGGVTFKEGLGLSNPGLQCVTLDLVCIQGYFTSRHAVEDCATVDFMVIARQGHLDPSSAESRPSGPVEGYHRLGFSLGSVFGRLGSGSKDGTSADR